MTELLADVGLANHCRIADAILNFVSVGNPGQAAAMWVTLIDVVLKYDEMALDYVRQHPDERLCCSSNTI